MGGDARIPHEPRVAPRGGRAEVAKPRVAEEEKRVAPRGVTHRRPVNRAPFLPKGAPADSTGARVLREGARVRAKNNASKIRSAAHG